MGVTASTIIKLSSHKEISVAFKLHCTARFALRPAARMTSLKIVDAFEGTMQSTPEPHPSNSRTVADETDIGSGKKTAGQLETEQIIKAITGLPDAGQDTAKGAEEEAAKAAGIATAAEDAQRAAVASTHDKAAHGQLQGEQNAARQEAEPGKTPDAPN